MSVGAASVGAVSVGAASAAKGFGPEGPPTASSGFVLEGPPAAHAANSDSARMDKTVRALVVTEADTKHVDLRDAQSTAQHVQLVEIVRRAYVDTMVVAVVDLDALDV